MKCICNNEVKSNLNIAFCPICGEKLEINNNELNQEELVLNLDNYLDEKRYDLALELTYNLKDEAKKHHTIIEIFDLFRSNKENVVNVYVFKKEYLLEAYANLLEIEKDNQELANKFEALKEEYLNDLEKTISSLKEGINQKKIELEKVNSIGEQKKIPHFNQILIGCIVTIVLGIVLGFVIDNKVVNIIGYVLSAIGVIVTLVVAYLTPSFDYNLGKKKIENQIQNSKDEIKEVEKLVEEIKNK